MASSEKAYINEKKRKAFESALTVIDSAYYREKSEEKLVIKGKNTIFTVIEVDLSDIEKDYDNLNRILFELSGREAEFDRSILYDDIHDIWTQQNNNPDEANFIKLFELTVPKDFPAYSEYLWNKYVYSTNEKGEKISIPNPDLKTTPIKSLEFVDQKNGTYLLIVNNDYKNPINCDPRKSTWDTLRKVAQGEKVSYSKNKTFHDYCNSNANNKIYTRTGCSITQIVRANRGILEPAVKMSNINTTTFNRRKKRMLKNA